MSCAGDSIQDVYLVRVLDESALYPKSFLSGGPATNIRYLFNPLAILSLFEVPTHFGKSFRTGWIQRNHWPLHFFCAENCPFFFYQLLLRHLWNAEAFEGSCFLELDSRWLGRVVVMVVVNNFNYATWTSHCLMFLISLIRGQVGWNTILLKSANRIKHLIVHSVLGCLNSLKSGQQLIQD